MELYSRELERLLGGGQHLDNLEPKVGVAAMGPFSRLHQGYELADGNAESVDWVEVAFRTGRAPYSP